jgi:hypothetical protein
MAVWPTHRRRMADRSARLRWDRRKRALARRAGAVKPNDTQRVKSKTKAAEDVDPDMWARL